MDKKIKHIKKKTAALIKDEDKLLKADKKRDRECDAGKRMMSKKK